VRPNGSLVQLSSKPCSASYAATRSAPPIGIHGPLIELLAGEFDPAIVRTFLRNWVRQSAYREAIARGGPRYDLDGLPCGEVSAFETRPQP
jgi:sRNA-binding protein